MWIVPAWFKTCMDIPWFQHCFHITNFSKLFSVSAWEFCHTNTFDGNEMYTRLDTLSYRPIVGDLADAVLHFLRNKYISNYVDKTTTFCLIQSILGRTNIYLLKLKQLSVKRYTDDAPTTINNFLATRPICWERKIALMSMHCTAQKGVTLIWQSLTGNLYGSCLSSSVTLAYWWGECA